jgi:hypothetical protein
MKVNVNSDDNEESSNPSSPENGVFAVIIITDLITFLSICLVGNLRQSQIIGWDDAQSEERNSSFPLRSRVVS